MTGFSPDQVVGIDIGGAHLKYARADRVAVSRSFPMWRHPQQLAETLLKDLIQLTPNHGPSLSLAVTMTGELADCFEDRVSGVQHIVAHTCDAAQRVGAESVLFYAVDGGFHDPDWACDHSELVASANWHALANLVGKQIAPNATLIDIGSTTTDIIPLRDGRVASQAQTDHDRLCEGSLVYVGCRRTPVCALVDQLRYRYRVCGVMNEVFATIDDARLILGHVDEDEQDCDTADGLPRTRTLASNRLARMIGLDRQTVSLLESEDLASQVLRAAREPIRHAIVKIASASDIVLAGHGPDLLDLPDGHQIISLSDRLGADVCRCAPSYAVAMLHQENSREKVQCDA